ncbi:MAG: GNAT family N-acetyltransferase [Flavobacteriaceae bacterium]|nr:GNAT family N-acetyltransferase [Flavobacteriaceae bacterium]
MKTLIGTDIYLRALEPTDLDFLYHMENDESLWEVSNTSTPFSKFVLSQYLENSHRDIFDIKQLRLVICKKDSDLPIGCIDLFDFEPKHHRVGIGIVIFSEEEKQKGYALQSIQLLARYVFQHLNIRTVFANITESNSASIQLFEKAGFTKVGVKKDWLLIKGVYKNELLYQLINNVH